MICPSHETSIFEFIFATEQKAKDFAEQVRSAEKLKAETSRYEERKMWQTTVTKYMVPTHHGVTALEQKLGLLAQPHGGKADGWGCFMLKENK